MINTFRKYGEIKVVHKDNGIVTLNLKLIPSIDEVGICVENASVNASYGFWLETKASFETKLYLVQEEFDWMKDGEAERLVKAIDEWIV